MSDLEAYLALRGVTRTVRERVLRLNPDPKKGDIIRGWYRKENPSRFHDLISKGEIIRRHGRAVWEVFVKGWSPRPPVRKFGKRVYLSQLKYRVLLSEMPR